jgi:ABC-type multidrug transport system fused ATPase/permease subunit
MTSQSKKKKKKTTKEMSEHPLTLDSDDDDLVIDENYFNKLEDDSDDDQEEQQDSHLLTVQKRDNNSEEDEEEEEEKPKWDGATFMRLLRLAWPERWLLAGGMVALIVSSLAFLVMPRYAGAVIDAVGSVGDSDSVSSIVQVHSKKEAMSLLRGAILGLIVFFVVGAVASFFRASLFTVAAERMVARLRKDVFGAILNQEVGFFDVNRTGELTNRLSSDCTVIRSTVTVNVSMALRSLGQAIGGIALLFVISWRLTFVMLAVTPIVAIGAVAYGRFVKRLSKETQDALAAGTTVADEAISNVRTVRQFSGERYEQSRYNARADEAYALGKRLAIAYGAFSGGASFAANSAIAAVLYYGATLVIDGDMTVGVLTSFILYTFVVAIAIGTLSALYGDVMKAIGASHRIFALVDRKPAIRSARRQMEGRRGTVLPSVDGLIEFESVSFTYPSRPDAAVLRDVSLTLRPGEVTALVGESGGGKSTIASLIDVLYEPDEGRVLLDGTSMADLERTWLTEVVSIVSQNPTLFASSIADNIAYALGDGADRERVIDAAKLANAHEFIMRFPGGYDTQVGERGVELSGGQRQRIAIARALLRRPAVLILDESTSNLDAESEHLVVEALDRLLEQSRRTTLVIAHRLSTIKSANQVIVIDRGRVAESGTHDELLANSNGRYTKLVKRQLIGYDDDDNDNE